MLNLLLGLCKSSSWCEFCVESEFCARKLRAVARNAFAWVRRRVYAKFLKGPWIWSQIGDNRLPEAQRFEVANRLRSRARCCVGSIGENVKRKTKSAAELLTAPWQNVWWWWSWLVSWAISVADIERRHRLSKALAHKADKKFEGVRAGHTIQDSKMICAIDNQFKDILQCFIS